MQSSASNSSPLATNKSLSEHNSCSPVQLPASNCNNASTATQHALSATRNVERGKQVFTKHCLACHKLNDEGHEVGPALGSITNKPDETILLDLLDPSGHIDPEYRSYIVTTEDGRIFTGVLASESPTSVTLRKEKGASESILRKDIDLIKASEVSLMPSNLHETVNPQSAADLISFLRQAFNRSGKR